MPKTYGDAQYPGTQVFIIRLWIEDLGEGMTEWRGQVKHVMSGEMRYFRVWANLVDCLKEMLPGIKDKEAT